jgi:hypothetical protein
VEKILKIYNLLVYRVNFILYCSALTLLTVGTISVYSVMQMYHFVRLLHDTTLVFHLLMSGSCCGTSVRSLVLSGDYASNRILDSNFELMIVCMVCIYLAFAAVWWTWLF